MSREPSTPAPSQPRASTEVEAALNMHDTQPDLRPPDFELLPEELERLKEFEVPDDLRRKLMEARIAEARKDPRYRERIAYALTGRENQRVQPAPEPPQADLEPRAGDAPKREAQPRARQISPAVARALIVGVLLGGFTTLFAFLFLRGEKAEGRTHAAAPSGRISATSGAPARNGAPSPLTPSESRTDSPPTPQTTSAESTRSPAAPANAEEPRRKPRKPTQRSVPHTVPSASAPVISEAVDVAEPVIPL